MPNDIHAAFEAKYKASAQDPACAEELRHFTDGWNARIETSARSAEGPEVQAIREALAAGPTPGPWLVKGRVHASGEAIRIESHYPTDEHHLYQVCDVLDANGYPRNQANLQFIAACNPEAITTILAALEARDAEIAELRAEVERLKPSAERYEWLRRKACIISTLAGAEFRMLNLPPATYIAPDPAVELDAAIDQARTPQPPRYPSTEGQRIARQIREGKEGKGVKGC